MSGTTVTDFNQALEVPGISEPPSKNASHIGRADLLHISRTPTAQSSEITWAKGAPAGLRKVAFEDLDAETQATIKEATRTAAHVAEQFSALKLDHTRS